MRRLFFALFAILIAAKAHADPVDNYRIDSQSYDPATGLAIPGTAESFYVQYPPQACGVLHAKRAEQFDGPPAVANGVTPSCAWRNASPGVFTVAYGQASSGTYLFLYNPIPLGPSGSQGDSCWRTASVNAVYGTTPPAGCEMCPDGQEWNAGAMACEAAECPDGEQFDPLLETCRPSCESPEFYHYDTASCKAQCPTGKSSPYYALSNKSDIGLIATSTVNGCPVQRHFKCVVDTAENSYYHGDEYTGQQCISWWEYSDELEVTMISQEQYEEETGSPGYYEGDDHSPVIRGDTPSPGTSVTIENISTAPDEAIDLVAVQSVCLGGVERLVITVNGAPEEVIFFGSCADINEDFVTPDRPSSNTSSAAIAAKVDTAIAKADENKSILDEFKALTDEIKTMTQGIGTAMGIMSGGEGEDPPAEFSGPEVGDAYESEHADGMDGVVKDAQDGIENSALEDWLEGLTPSLPTEVAECPSWSFVPPMIGGAEVTFAPDCRIWDWLKALFYVGSVAACYGIVLGRRA